ncbi:MAG: hypothetical protein JNN11_03695 [Candidatus Doudnabacteria bacterium]|nr:hypothetical protein [Candidatus Doudnabacteria bacterium]
MFNLLQKPLVCNNTGFQGRRKMGPLLIHPKPPRLQLVKMLGVSAVIWILSFSPAVAFALAGSALADKYEDDTLPLLFSVCLLVIFLCWFALSHVVFHVSYLYQHVAYYEKAGHIPQASRAEKMKAAWQLYKQPMRYD